MSKSIAQRLEALGYGRPGVEIDQAIHRALDEVEQRRAREGAATNRKPYFPDAEEISRTIEYLQGGRWPSVPTDREGMTLAWQALTDLRDARAEHQRALEVVRETVANATKMEAELCAERDRLLAREVELERQAHLNKKIADGFSAALLKEEARSAELEAENARLREALSEVLACEVCGEDYGRCAKCDNRMRAALAPRKEGT